MMAAWSKAVKADITDERVACVRRQAKALAEARLQSAAQGDAWDVDEMEAACKEAEVLMLSHAGVDSRLVALVNRKAKQIRAAEDLYDEKSRGSVFSSYF